MSQKISKKTIFAVIASLGFAGFWAINSDLFSDDDLSTADTASSTKTPNTILSPLFTQNGHPPSIGRLNQLPANKLDVPPALNLESVPSLTQLQRLSAASAPASANKKDGTAADDTENVSDSVLLSRQYYMRYLAADTIADKVYNLVWALQKYGSDINPESFEKASKGLKISKEELINNLRVSTSTLFKQPTPYFTSKFQTYMHYHDRVFAHPYVGVTPNGDIIPSQSISMTRTSIDELRRVRNAYALEAAAEIAAEVQSKTEALFHAMDNSVRKGRALREVISILDLNEIENMDLKFAIVDSVINVQRDNGTYEEKLARLNISVDVAQSFYSINKMLGEQFEIGLLELAKRTKYNPHGPEVIKLSYQNENPTSAALSYQYVS